MTPRHRRLRHDPDPLSGNRCAPALTPAPRGLTPITTPRRHQPPAPAGNREGRCVAGAPHRGHRPRRRRHREGRPRGPPRATANPGKASHWGKEASERARRVTHIDPTGSRQLAVGRHPQTTPRHTPQTTTTRPPQPGRHRLGHDKGHPAETTGHQPTFREHAETQATVQPGDPPPLSGTRSRCLPGPAARRARRGAPPSFAFAPTVTVPQQTNPRGSAPPKALPSSLHT